MTDPFLYRLEKEIARRREENLLREIKIYDHYRLNLSSNDYFQLRHHPLVVDGARKAAQDFGSGSGASPLLTGFLPCHQRLLDQLLQWKKKPAGMLFNAGFLANQALLKHLPGKNDLVLADRLIHHSIAQSLAAGPARFKRYNHLDLNQLQEFLEKNHQKYETIFVVTESVFSMDGDYPDLKALVEIKREFPFVLILDEAHGTGVYGQTGAGLAEEMGIAGEVDILIGTLGKALASMGGYVLARSQTVIDYLINTAGEFIYSTFLSPAQVGAASAAVEILQQAAEKRSALRELSFRFREQLCEIGCESNRFDSPIIPVIVGEPQAALKLQKHFLEHGILVGAVRPPTVPPNTSRLRISLHTEVSDEQLNEIHSILKQWKNS